MKKGKNYRIVSDSMGSLKIPQKMLYGPSTQRAIQNFPISGRRFERVFIYALAQIKLSTAKANRKLGLLSKSKATAIIRAAMQVRKGMYDDHFLVDIFQTGSGTSTNMNMNEVIATLANVHPNDDVNKGQSSNDIFPSAMHIASLLRLRRELLPELARLQKALSRKSKEFSDTYKLGRTHLQDALPITLGQEFGGYANQINKAIKRLKGCLPNLRELAIGGTAVGTGLNTHPGFAKAVCSDLNQTLRERFYEADDHFEAQSSREACVELSGQLKALAISLHKIGEDIRWLGSGPRAGLGELKLPAVQPGSSIMPGKVNPVLCEALIQVCYEVIGNDLTVSLCGQSGNFELNTGMPLMAHKILESLKILTAGIKVFREKCIMGLKANKMKCLQSIESSLMLSTILVPKLGYDQAVEIAQEANRKGKTIREIVCERNLIPEQELDKLLNLKNMIQPFDT